MGEREFAAVDATPRPTYRTSEFSFVFCSSLSWLVKSLSAMLTLEAAKITAVRRSAAASRRSIGVAGIGLRHDAIRNCPISDDFFCSISRLARWGLVGRRLCSICRMAELVDAG